MSTDTIAPVTDEATDARTDAPTTDALTADALTAEDRAEAKRTQAQAKAQAKAEAKAEAARLKAEAKAEAKVAKDEQARVRAEEKARAKAEAAERKAAAQQASATSKASAATVPALSPEQMEAFGDELDAIRRRILDDLGDEDADYIRGVVKAQRGFEVAGRALFYLPPAWPLAVASLSISKILDNMEIGHNVMHGQYDWMGDPGLNSRMYDWDNVCPGEQWKNSHNYIHHTFTNILGKDRDIGYGILRMDEDQKWHPYYLGNPLYAVLLMLFFEWGVAMHDLEVENIVAGTRKIEENKALHAGIMRKVKQQALKDYVLFPALTGPLFPLTLAGNATANLVRNVWAFNIIFCGHFPAGVATFTQEECEDETRGHWYYRQLLGSANITGGPLFHLMTGNLSHQIEHHLFPDLPARRYPQIAHEVRDICQRYGLPYNTGPLGSQLLSVAKKICKMALPGSSTTTPDTAPASRVPSESTTVAA